MIQWERESKDLFENQNQDPAPPPIHNPIQAILAVFSWSNQSFFIVVLSWKGVSPIANDYFMLLDSVVVS